MQVAQENLKKKRSYTTIVAEFDLVMQVAGTAHLLLVFLCHFIDFISWTFGGSLNDIFK